LSAVSLHCKLVAGKSDSVFERQVNHTLLAAISSTADSMHCEAAWWTWPCCCFCISAQPPVSSLYVVVVKSHSEVQRLHVTPAAFEHLLASHCLQLLYPVCYTTVASFPLSTRVKQVLHSDLKVRNVLLKSDASARGCIAKVADFGLAVRMDCMDTHVSAFQVGLAIRI
jgi:hypothetical protein